MISIHIVRRQQIFMNKILKKQIKRVERQEIKLMNKQGNPFVKRTWKPIQTKIEEFVPDKLRETLNITFYKGFQLVFDKGSKYIEMTYNKDKKQLQYDLNNYAVDRALSKKHINSLDKQAGKSNWMNSTISVIEGTILGALGIGLPDIPLFIAVIMKTIYEVALSYGYEYESEEEKYYVLLIICSAMSTQEKKKEFDHQLVELQAKMDENIVFEIELKKQMKITAKVLSDALLTAKFIQGFPIIGIVGGIVNHSIIRKIGKYASLKYKKRYLLQKTKKISVTDNIRNDKRRRRYK